MRRNQRLWPPVLCAGLAGIIMSAPGPVRGAECRPFIYGMGHYLASWAGQPWNYDEQAMDKMAEIGATAVWVDFPWAAMEAVEGTIDWSYADHQVSVAWAHRLEMFAFVGTTPDWAKLHPELPGHRTPPSEDHIQQFHDFHVAVAARYAGYVSHYQFWNEPSGCGWINDCGGNGDCTLFTLWQKRAYDALKAGNPNCIVSAGGFDGDPAGYVQCMYNQLAGETAFDAVSIHPYAAGGPGGPGTSGEGIDYSDLTTVRAVMVDNGDFDKKMWITEYGWSTNDQNRKADDLVEVLTELKKSDYHYLTFVKYLVLNNWDNHDGDPSNDFCCYGLTDENFTPYAGFYAFRDLDKTFPDDVDFVADTTAGPGPLTVQFHDISCVAGAYAWFWEFGDDQTSDEPAPLHIYAADGIYTVRLTVYGDNGTFFEEKPDYIRVGVLGRIDNPSFEDPRGFLEGWSSCLAGESSIKHNPSTQLPDPRFHHGENSAGMSSDRPGDRLGAGAIFQEVAVTPGQTYHVRCWGALTEANGEYIDDWMELRIRDGDSAPINCLDNGANIEANSQLIAHLDGQPASAWVALEGDITPAQNVITVIAYWKYAGSAWGVKSLHLDDWSIEDVTPPVLLSAVSRRSHALAGGLDIALPLDPPASAGIETRSGGPQTVVLTFSEPIRAADGTLDGTEITLSAGDLGPVSVDGNVMTIAMSNVPDGICLQITLDGLTDPHGSPLAGDNDVHVRVLAGDTNGDGRTNLADMAQVKLMNGQPLLDAWGQPIPENTRFDVNCDGQINLADMAQVKLLNGSGPVACP